MHVLFVIKALHRFGGMERITSVIASGLAQRGFQVGIVVLERGGAPVFPLVGGVQCFYVADAPGRGHFSRLRYLARQLQPDVAVQVGSNRSWLILRAFKGVRTYVWEHFHPQVQHHPLHGWMRRYAARYAAGIVVLAREYGEYYREHYGAERVEVIPNPVTIHPEIATPAQARKVVALGRFAKVKGFDLLLKAWAAVVERYPDWALELVGSGRRQRQLEQLARQLGVEEHVRFLPFTTEVARVLASAGIFALSSRMEGFPLVVLEAQACGLPVVAMHCTPVLEEMVVEGETGLLVPNGDVRALAEGLAHLMGEPALRAAFGRRAQEHIQVYALDEVLTLWERLLR